MTKNRRLGLLSVLLGTFVMLLGSFLAAGSSGFSSPFVETDAARGGAGWYMAVLGLGVFLVGSVTRVRARGFA